jgi:hypothetical protein
LKEKPYRDALRMEIAAAIRPLNAAVLAAGPCDPLIGSKQKHARSLLASRPFRINVFITPCSS